MGMKNFTAAMVIRGHRLVQEAEDRFDQTGVSDYSEGWARGFAAAAKLADDFARDTGS